jgi:hypothetical protein
MSYKIAEYPVDTNGFADYIKSARRRRATTAIFLFIMLIASQVIIGVNLDDRGVHWVMLIAVALAAGAFYFGLNRWSGMLEKFAAANYKLTDTGIVLMINNVEERNFSYADISVVHASVIGTTIVKGSTFSKLNYIRPKKIPTSFDAPDRIFIPTVTIGYEMLISEIKLKAANALKI